MSPKYQLNKEDGIKILQAFSFSLLSSAIGFLILLIPALDIPPNYVFVIPIINGLLYTLKRFVDGVK